jgi:hypothetical protein
MRVAQIALVPTTVVLTTVVVALPARVDRIDRPSVVRIDFPSKVAQTDLPSVDLPVVDQLVFPKEKKIVQIPWASDQCLL